LAPAASLEEVVARRAEFLAQYQDAAYAGRYRRLVAKAAAAEAARAPGSSGFALALARSYFKLMAYKDEYEVARLYAETGFLERIARDFEGDYRLNFHLAPPSFARRAADTGELQKQAFGPWMMRAFRLLAKLKGLRGTRLDPFGRTPERRMERQLIGDYERLADELMAGLDPDNHGLAVEIARLPEHIRGFGHVKERSLKEAKQREADLLHCFRNPAPRQAAAD
jgi:indolepyruvate ferredoxin oxidoreductase